MSYRFLPHTADTILEIESTSVEGVLEDATAAARLLFVGEAPTGSGQRGQSTSEQRDVSITANGYDDLLYRYVRELIVWFQLDAFLPTRLETVNLSERQLVAQVHGERFTEGVHEPQPEVKAVTRHQLAVAQTETGWRATLVLDL